MGMDQFDSDIKNNFAAVLDVPGFNYKPHRYPEAYAKLPQAFLLGAETASTVSSRGVYKFPVVKAKQKKYPDNQSLILRPGVLQLVADARRGICRPGRPALHHGRVCVDGLRLPGRAHALRRVVAFAQLLLRHSGPGRPAQRPVLPLPRPLEHRPAHPAPAAALDLARPRGPDHARVLLHQLPLGRAVRERPEPGPPHQSTYPTSPRPATA